MEIISPIIDILTGLWTCTANVNHIRHLDKKIKSLTEAKRELYCIYRDVNQTVDREKENYKILKHVENWIAEAESLIKEVDDVLQKGNEEIENKCLGCCPRNCYSHYKLGKKVVEKIEAVEKLVSKGRFNDVAADRLPRPRVDEILVEETVEIESKESEVWKFIEDESVGIIGLFGMGGVGKTTLLKKLNNMFNHTTHDFDVVIWVTISSVINLEKVQNVIRKKLEISDDEWNDEDENSKAIKIHKKLSSKRFVLLLDDVWEPLDRIKVGIPLPKDQNRSKIIITTRSEQVCRSMGVDRGIYNVRHLSQEAALELFRQKVTEKVYSLPGIQKLVDTVAEECKGLPLALITIGSAMSGKTSPAEWRTAINKLKNYPSKLFEDMGKDIFHILMFSYDSLNDDSQKECFLYCSTFPEDHAISKDELIDLWIGEGFLDEYATLDEKRDEGENIVESLKRSSMLERVEDSDQYVKMHDVLRDMALCIASKEGKEIVAYGDCKSFKEREKNGWQNTVRISLCGWKIKDLPRIPYSCRHLLTFLARGTFAETFPKGFFKSTHNALRVLDLQGNYSLRQLPHEMCKLIKLQYLNLSDSSITRLPNEVKNLRQLRIMLLDGTSSLEYIPYGVISNLSSLQVFSRMSTTRNKLRFQRFVDSTLLKELELLKHVREIGLTLFTLNCVHRFESSRKLRSCIKRLTVNCSILPSFNISHSTASPAGYFKNLHDLCVTNCAVKDLTCLKHAPRLRFVFADNCWLLEEILACEFGCSEIEEQKVFQHLKQLNFRRLPCLKSICRKVMPFSSLERIYVEDCPNLRKLPLKSVDAKISTSTLIVGKRIWWDQLEWQDEATKRLFSSKFLELGKRYYYRPSYTYEASTHPPPLDLTLKAWPLTGLEQLRAGLRKSHNSVLSSSLVRHLTLKGRPLAGLEQLRPGLLKSRNSFLPSSLKIPLFVRVRLDLREYLRWLVRLDLGRVYVPLELPEYLRRRMVGNE